MGAEVARQVDLLAAMGGDVDAVGGVEEPARPGQGLEGPQAAPLGGRQLAVPVVGLGERQRALHG